MLREFLSLRGNFNQLSVSWVSYYLGWIRSRNEDGSVKIYFHERYISQDLAKKIKLGSVSHIFACALSKIASVEGQKLEVNNLLFLKLFSTTSSIEVSSEWNILGFKSTGRLYKFDLKLCFVECTHRFWRLVNSEHVHSIQILRNAKRAQATIFCKIDVQNLNGWQYRYRVK